MRIASRLESVESTGDRSLRDVVRSFKIAERHGSVFDLPDGRGHVSFDPEWHYDLWLSSNRGLIEETAD
jgi:hypothetical protein